jgi:hypothetical protein
VHNLNEIYNTDFRDKEGHQIRIGDIVEYRRKKKTSWYRQPVPAGTLIKAQVNEIIVRVKKDDLGTWVLRAINVTTVGLGNMPGVSEQSYRIYNISHVTNTTPPIKATSDDNSIDELVQITESFGSAKSNDDVFSIGLTTP